MNKGILAIYDAEYDFASRLADFLNSRNDSIFKIYAFTDFTALKEFAAKNLINILLVSENMMDGNIEELGAEEIIVLSGSSRGKTVSGYKAVEKYQAADGIFREVMEYAAQCTKPERNLKTGLWECMTIGVYSPVRRCGKTTFALTLSHLLSSTHRVLYMNFEEYSGFRQLLKTEYIGDLSDLVYFYMQDKPVLKSKLYAIKRECAGFDYIPPMMFSNDIRNVDMKVWTSLINDIQAFGCYDVLVLDLSDMLADIFEVLDLCNLIYMPTAADFVSISKTEEFRQVLKDRHKEGILRAIKDIEIKGDGYIESSNYDVVKIITGGFSRYIKNMIGGMQI